jgi:thiol-disulfide isomerase/thioredoxin
MGRYSLRVLVAAAVLAVAITLVTSASSTGYYDFKLEELNTDVTMERDALVKEKPLVIFVWSAECPHCKRQMPYVSALYKKLDIEEVNFVSVAIDKNRSAIKEYVDEKDLSFPVLTADSGEISDFYTEKGWPTTYVFAPGGKYVGLCETTGTKYIGEVMDMLEEAEK